MYNIFCVLLCRRNMLQINLRNPTFFSFPKLFFVLSPSIRLSGCDDLSPSKQGFQVGGRGGRGRQKGAVEVNAGSISVITKN